MVRNTVLKRIVITACVALGCSFLLTVHSDARTKTSNNTRTMMVYMVGSNLESGSGQAINDILEMMNSNNDENFNIVIQTGGANDWHNEIAGFKNKNYIPDGEVARFKISGGYISKLDTLGKVDMGKPETLTDFITFAKDNYPADEYILVMWDHGGAIPISFGLDEIFNPNQDYDKMMCDVEIGQALKNAGVYFDALIFDACEMCSLELFMNIKDYVDYVVAAESVVYSSSKIASGVDYISWIKYADKDKAATQYYCEKIVKDYMKFMDKCDCDGSMSVIRMDQIDDVYKAYVKYMKDAYKEISTAEGYERFIKVRESLSKYEGTDAIDLSTFAGEFKNENTTRLQNRVASAVVFTDSEVEGGTGITIYSPYKYPYVYNDGRKSFEALDYDKNIMLFYDTVASKLLYYNKWTNSAGDWYIDPTKKASAAAEEPTGLERKLNFTQMDGYIAVPITQDEWKKIKSVELKFYMYADQMKGYRIYGQDYQYVLDNAGNIRVEAPTRWLAISGFIPTSYCIGYDINGNGWNKTYIIDSNVNGKEAPVVVRATSENPDGEIIGYYEDEELMNFKNLNDDDDVEIFVELLDTDTNKTTRVSRMKSKAKDLYSHFFSPADNSYDNYIVSYIITDVYDKKQTTELLKVNVK